MDNLLKYYTPSGKFKKYLMKQEVLESIDMLDSYSKLIVRTKNFLSIKEVNNTTDARIITLVTDGKELLNILNTKTNELMTTSLKREDFCNEYDRLASIAEVMEDKICKWLDTQGDSISEDAHILKKRTGDKTSTVKDLGKSADAKANWKKNKHKYKKAIQQFHKSSAGKAFHRNLNRFNKMRVRDEAASFSQDDVLQVSKGISSLLTHLIIEVQNTSNQTVESVLGASPEVLATLKELFTIFQGLATDMFESYFTKDKELMAEVLEVITEFYEMERGS